MMLNSRSLLKKMCYLRSWVSLHDPDIVGVTESWANSNVSDAELDIMGYDLFRKDRPVDREGGGVLLYIKKLLMASEVKLSTSFPEVVCAGFADSYGKCTPSG